MSGDSEFAGHTKNMLTADFKRTKPYRITTGGEDFNMCFFDGPPFKLVSNKKEHSNFVSCIRYNLDCTQFASTGFDKKINIWDTATNEILYTIESTVENAHTASIIALLWIDNNTILTNSVDKTCKIWDLETKSCKFTLLPAEKDNLTQDHIGCGIIYSSVLKKIISLNLNGRMNIWNFDTIEDGKLPDMILTGHQNSVYHVRYSKQLKKIVSCDSNGYFCKLFLFLIFIFIIYFLAVWDQENKNESFRPNNVKNNDFTLCAIGTHGYSVDFKGNFFYLDFVENKLISQGSVKGEPLRVRIINKEENTILILVKDKLYKISNTEIKKELKLPNESEALEINETRDHVYIGDKKGNLHIYDYELNLVSTTEIFSNAIYDIKVSNAGKLVAFCDNTKVINIWDIEEMKVYASQFVFHQGRVYDMAWNEDDSRFISCSLDRSVILWDIPGKQKLNKFDSVDKESCFSNTFVDGGYVVSGAMGTLYKFNN